MMNELIKYPAYKDTGVLWIGESPAHWNLMPNRALMRRRKTLVGPRHAEYQLLSLTKKGIIVRDVESGKGKFTADMSTFQEVHKGDLVFCLFDIPETPRTVGLSYDNGMITGAYTVFECPDPTLAAFLNLFYQAMDDRKLLSPLYSGLRNTIQATRFLGIKTPVPAPAERSSIVRFLDHADRRIKRCILAKLKMIKLLEEQKQAIIHQAVTRGLDPNVRLKPSGVEWLGDVPEHWGIKPLKFWTRINAKTLGENTDSDFSFRYIDIGIVKTGLLVEEPPLIRFGSAPSRARRVLNEGDTIISTVRTYLKAIWFVNRDAKDLIASTGFAVLSPKYDVEPEYLSYVIQGKNFVDRVTANSNGIAYPAIAETVLGRFKLALPPDRREQNKINEWIKESSKPADLMIERTHHEISLLREYRTRLFADVVTGKLDVREAAKNLPDKQNETEKLEEVDVSAEGDGGDEEHEVVPEEVEA